MTTPEGSIKRKLDRKLAQFRGVSGFFVYSPNAGPHGTNGIPDRVAIVNGRFIGIECKADGGKELTALQMRIRDQILDAGGAYFIVYDDYTISALVEHVTLELVCKKLKDASTT